MRCSRATMTSTAHITQDAVARSTLSSGLGECRRTRGPAARRCPPVHGHMIDVSVRPPRRAFFGLVGSPHRLGSPPSVPSEQRKHPHRAVAGAWTHAASPLITRSSGSTPRSSPRVCPRTAEPGFSCFSASAPGARGLVLLTGLALLLTFVAQVAARRAAGRLQALPRGQGSVRPRRRN